MSKLIFAFCIIIIIIPIGLISQANTEIYLFDLQFDNGKIIISNPENISNRKGYDNQPFFHPQEPLIYYSSFDDSLRSDIIVYNFETKQTTKFTETRVREYSPTVTPDGQFISCIIQKDNGEQNLSTYPIGGGSAIDIINDMIVGYHAWIDEENLILFVLGEPHELRTYNIANRKSTIVTKDIGRTLSKTSGFLQGCFVQKTIDEWSIMKVDINNNETEIICSTIEGREDFVWFDDEIILMNDGFQIYYKNVEVGDEWKKVEYDFKLGKGNEFMKDLTRMALSNNRHKIAIVVGE